MIRWLLLVLIACTSRSAPDAGSAAPSHPAPAASPVVTGVHGSSIATLAISDDGRAAVSQDGSGGTRVWPTLDGTREPFVIALATTVELAIGRGDDELLLASRDEVGGVDIVQLSVTGQVFARSRIAPDPETTSIAVVGRSVLAQRADQTLGIFDAAGKLVSRLEAPPGSRIQRIVTRSGRILALLEQGGALRARWIVRGAWASTLPVLEVELDAADHSPLALSPDGSLLLAVHLNNVMLFDLARGLTASHGRGVPVGFIDNKTFAVHDSGELRWITVGDPAAGARTEKTLDRADLWMVGDGVVLGGLKRSLTLRRNGKTEYLGYRIGQIGSLRLAGERVLVIGGDQRPVYVDANLIPAEAVRLPDDMRALSDVVPIDDRFVITTHKLGSSKFWSLAVVDLDEQKTTQNMQHVLWRGEIEYHPATQLLALTDAAASWLLPWDPHQQSFATWYRVLAGAPSRVHVLDPARNAGIAALAMRTIDGSLEINEIHGDDLVVGKPVAARRSYRVGGQLRAADRAGNVYVIDQGALAVWQRGQLMARVADVGAQSNIAPHPGGDYIAVQGDARLQLFDRSGTQRWETEASLARHVGWLGDDLVVEYEGGLGKIDAATGALIHRACGWSFGLSALPGNDDREEGSICDAP